MRKFILIGIVVLLIAVAVGTYNLLSNLDAIVAAAIERHGSEATGTKVGVNSVDIALREGRGSIQSLKIGSPEGFGVGDALSFDDIVIDLDVSSVRDDPMVIDEIRIQAPVVNVEFAKDGSSNIDELRKHLQSHSGDGSKSGQATQKKVRIDEFTLEQGRIELDATALGIEKRSLSLPAIHLSDVGGAGGAPPDEIAQLILTRVVKDAASEIAGSEVESQIKKQLGDTLSDEAKGLLDKVVN